MAGSAAVVLAGSTTTINAAAHEIGRHSAEANARVTVLGLELVQMALFAGWGGMVVIGALNLAYPVAIGQEWLRFGTWLVS